MGLRPLSTIQSHQRSRNTLIENFAEYYYSVMAISLFASVSPTASRQIEDTLHPLLHRASPKPSPSNPRSRLFFPIHPAHPHRAFVGAASAVSRSSGIESSVEKDDAKNLLDEVEVFDLSGNAIPLYDLWKDRRAVVAFARHFGCVLCRKRADYLAANKDIMDASGVALVLIGPGSVDQAKTFSEQTRFKGEVYADPSYSSYRALRFVSGVSTTFTPGAGLKIIKAYMEGFRQDWALSFEEDTRTRGGWQQGGIIVAGPGKSEISYIHRDKEAGDDPDIEDILKACCS